MLEMYGKREWEQWGGRPEDRNEEKRKINEKVWKSDDREAWVGKDEKGWGEKHLRENVGMRDGKRETKRKKWQKRGKYKGRNRKNWRVPPSHPLCVPGKKAFSPWSRGASKTHSQITLLPSPGLSSSLSQWSLFFGHPPLSCSLVCCFPLHPCWSPPSYPYIRTLTLHPTTSCIPAPHILGLPCQPSGTEGGLHVPCDLPPPQSQLTSLGFVFLCLSLVVISQSCLVPFVLLYPITATEAMRVIYGGRSSRESSLSAHGEVLWKRRVRRDGCRVIGAQEESGAWILGNEREMLF